MNIKEEARRMKLAAPALAASTNEARNVALATRRISLLLTKMVSLARHANA